MPWVVAPLAKGRIAGEKAKRHTPTFRRFSASGGATYSIIRGIGRKLKQYSQLSRATTRTGNQRKTGSLWAQLAEYGALAAQELEITGSGGMKLRHGQPA